MKRILSIFLISVLYSIASFGAYAQDVELTSEEKKYYNEHPEKLLPDANNAFKESKYLQTQKLCRFHSFVMSDVQVQERNKLWEDAKTCEALSSEMLSLKSEGKLAEALEKADALLRLNIDDKDALELKSNRVAMGSIKVTSSPAGAAIWIDGKDSKFVTPDIIEGVSPGNHNLQLRKDGYMDYTETVLVTGGGRSVVNSTLQKDKSGIIGLICTIAAEYGINFGVTTIADVKRNYNCKSTGKEREVSFKSNGADVEVKYNTDNLVNLVTIHPKASINGLYDKYSMNWNSSYTDWDNLFVGMGEKSEPFEPYYGDQVMIMHVDSLNDEGWSIVVMCSGDRKNPEKSKPFCIICSWAKKD